jgi:hypothetical protein
LTKQLVAGVKRKLISAREQQSGRVFWHKMLSEFSVSPALAGRVAAVGAGVHQLAGAQALAGPAAGSKLKRLSAVFGALGQEIQGHHRAATATPPPRGVTLPAPGVPALSVVFDAGSHGVAALDNIRKAAAALHQAQAEAVLTDDGADSQVLRQQRLARNLKYILVPGASAAVRRTQAGTAARGAVLLFLEGAQQGLGPALLDLPQCAQDRVIVSADIADALRRVAPASTAGAADIRTHVPFAWSFATPREFLLSVGGFDERMDDGAGLDVLDWILRAVQVGIPLAVWRGPAALGVKPGRMPQNATAGRQFAARWVLGQG